MLATQSYEAPAELVWYFPSCRYRLLYVVLPPARRVVASAGAAWSAAIVAAAAVVSAARASAATMSGAMIFSFDDYAIVVAMMVGDKEGKEL